MRNRFEAICYRCGQPVTAGQGFMSFTKREHVEAWPEVAGAMPFALVEHEECHENFAGTFIHHHFNPSKENNG